MRRSRSEGVSMIATNDSRRTRLRGTGIQDRSDTQQVQLRQQLEVLNPPTFRIHFFLPLCHFIFDNLRSSPEPTIGPAVPERLQNVAPTQHVPIQPPSRPPIISIAPGQTISAAPTGPAQVRPGMPMGMPMPGMPMGMPGMHMGMPMPGMHGMHGMHGMPGMPMMMPHRIQNATFNHPTSSTYTQHTTTTTTTTLSTFSFSFTK